jgi:hypothetical protein
VEVLLKSQVKQGAAWKYMKLPSCWHRAVGDAIGGAKIVTPWIFVSPSDSITWGHSITRVFSRRMTMKLVPKGFCMRR